MEVRYVRMYVRGEDDRRRDGGRRGTQHDIIYEEGLVV